MIRYNNCENWKVNLEIGKLKNYLEMECQKIKFRKLETRKIILRIECQKYKSRKLETRKINLRMECRKIKFRKLET